MSELDHAWAAGFFDGEGCVQITRCAPKRTKWISCSISQSDTRPLERFRAIFGGKIIPVGPSALSARQKYRWYITGRANIIAVMETMRPYLSEPKLEQWDAAQRECPIMRPRRVFGLDYHP